MTELEASKVLDGREHSPIHELEGDDYTIDSRFTMSAGVENDFVCNGNIKDYKIMPDHVTKLWETTLNIATFETMMNTPMIVVDVGFIFDPDSSSAGVVTLRVYANETVPVFLKAVTVPYKAVADEMTALITFPAEDTVGRDVKNKGVKFTIESSGAGTGYDPKITIYRT